MFGKFFSYFFLSLFFYFFISSYIYLREEIMFLPAYVVLFVCEQLYAKTFEQISMKFSGSVGGGPRRNRLDFGSYR